MKTSPTVFQRSVSVVILGAALRLVWFSHTISAADLRLASPFSDHMVLQRAKPIAVWGSADAGESVSVAFDGQSKTSTADGEGKWSLKLDALNASAEGRVFKVTGKDGRFVEVKDVLVGEVWFGSGQSNMAMAVASAAQFDAEKASANSPHIRYYGESSGPAEIPQAEGKGSWQVCTPATVGRFSATLYFFGREIHRELGVPVGLLCAAAGATHIESWISREAQASDPETKTGYEAQLKGWQNFDEAKLKADYPQKLAAWKLSLESGKASARDMPWSPETTIAHIRRKGPPAGLYNGKVFNLAPFTLRGILWYQGESNASHPDLYQRQLTQLVTSWRSLWKDDLPFAWVQLPNFTALGEGWPRMREAMLKALELPKTGMAITIDIGDRKDIHPTNKQEVGRRLSLWALGKVYGKPVPAVSGPLPDHASVNGNVIAVSFQHANGGLKSENGEPIKGFEIAGADRLWKPATARIDGTRVLVSSTEISSPMAVRYAWHDFPDCNLYNGAGLPASPFRTDDWK